MPDVFSSSKRSEVMSLIRGSGNKSTEMLFAAMLRKAAIKGWRRHLALTVPAPARLKESTRNGAIRTRPDFVFPSERLAVFLDGCFWHQCPQHFKAPASNAEFWTMKIQRNVCRDRATTASLRANEWSVLRFWEHELKDERAVIRKMKRRLSERRRDSGRIFSGIASLPD